MFDPGQPCKAGIIIFLTLEKKKQLRYVSLLHQGVTMNQWGLGFNSGLSHLKIHVFSLSLFFYLGFIYLFWGEGRKGRRQGRRREKLSRCPSVLYLITRRWQSKQKPKRTGIESHAQRIGPPRHPRVLDIWMA